MSEITYTRVRSNEQSNDSRVVEMRREVQDLLDAARDCDVTGMTKNDAMIARAEAVSALRRRNPGGWTAK